MILRQIALDTETTGINKLGNYYLGHKIIEIGAIEIINNQITDNIFHEYIKPNRSIDQEAYKIHGISNNFLQDKPIFSEIINKFINFIYGSELIIHNAEFDINFINYELNIINYKIKDIRDICNVIDSLSLARKKFPGKKNNLNALCNRYNINNSDRVLHGALLDAKLLAKVYLLLIRIQMNIDFNVKLSKESINTFKSNLIDKNKKNNVKLTILKANNYEIKNHIGFLKFIKKKYNN